MGTVAIEASRCQSFKGQSHSREGCCLDTWSDRPQSQHQLGVPGHHPESKDPTAIPVSGIVVLEASVPPGDKLETPLAH